MVYKQFLTTHARTVRTNVHVEKHKCTQNKTLCGHKLNFVTNNLTTAGRTGEGEEAFAGVATAGGRHNGSRPAPRNETKLCA